MLPTLADHLGGGERDQGPGRPGDLDDQLARRRRAYPIVSQTFLDVYKDPCKDGGASSAPRSGLKTFLTYAFGAGQKTLGSGGNQLPYAPLPASLAAKDNAQLAKMTCNGSPILPVRDGLEWRQAPPRLSGGRSAFERSPLSRLPDQVLQWGLTALAALILVLIAYFFIRLIGQSTTAFSTFGLQLRLRQRLGRLAQHLPRRRRCSWGR